MVRLTLRNVAANRLRFVLTTFAVLLGVSFVVASLVLTDGLLKTFDEIVENANEGIDVQVRASDEFSETEFEDRPIDVALVADIETVDGVELVEPAIQTIGPRPLDGTGDDAELIETQGPIITVNWSDAEIDGIDLVEGRAPGDGEFVIDVGAADRENLVIGEQYDMVGGETGRETFTLVGTALFGNENSLGGAILVFFSLGEAQRLTGIEGQAQYINVSAEPGTDTEELITRLNDALPDGVEAVSGAQVTEEGQDDFSEIITIFGNVLLGFAAVAVFVSTFIIGNTFNILLGRRVRQLALLRALGASMGQVRASSLLEALIIGVVASLLGIGGGILLALGLAALMNALGLDLPDFGIIVSARTIIVALLVGVVVTLLASFSPARRAASVPPVAAMREGFRFGSGEGTRRTIIAIILAVFGAALLGFGLFSSSDNGTALLLGIGLGAVLVFVSVSMFMPLFSSPSASFLGAPLEKLPGGGFTGHMARENAARDNKRTARTASGLMIGLALIAMATVVASSLKESFKAELGSTLVADWLITEQQDLDFPTSLAPEIAALPEFAETTAVRYGAMQLDGDEKDVTALDVTVLTALLEVDVSSGDPADAADPGSIVIHRDVADDNALEVGDELIVEFAATGEQTLVVRAIYDNAFLVGNYLLDLSAWDANFDLSADNVVTMKTADGVDEATAAAALEPFEGDFPQLQFETRDEFRDRLEGQLDTLLIIINVFLGLAIVIALLGIANTMALSVLERTREIGLMRAIGMTRGQTRGMIALEAGVVSLFGALLGVIVGLAFGWLAVTAIPDSIIDRLAIPALTLVVYVIIATVAGLLAALIPARRAARLNVLEAITHM